MSSKKTKSVTTTSDLIKRAHEDLNRSMAYFESAMKSLKRVLDVKEFAKELKDAPQPEKAAPKKSAQAAKKPAAPAEPAKTAPTIPRHRTPMSVRLTPHEITLNIGSHPVKQLAENDAKDFLNNPSVFWYRPMQFPDPRRYQVQPHIEGAKVVKRADAKFTRAPWTVSVNISIVGDDKKCDAWGVGVLAKNKGDQE